MNHPHLLAIAQREIAAGTKIVTVENGALREVSEEEFAQRIAAARHVANLFTPDPKTVQRLALQFPEPQKPNRAQRRAKK